MFLSDGTDNQAWPALHSSGRVRGFDAVLSLTILCHVIYRLSRAVAAEKDTPGYTPGCLPPIRGFQKVPSANAASDVFDAASSEWFNESTPGLHMELHRWVWQVCAGWK
jgi:hypothetical protein